MSSGAQAPARRFVAGPAPLLPWLLAEALAAVAADLALRVLLLSAALLLWRSAPLPGAPPPAEREAAPTL